MSTLDFLRANEHKSGNTFLQEAQFVRDNWGWLKYSYAVAIRVREQMDKLGWTQKQLAEALGCTQQHISILLKGRANMTLETLSKLEDALHFDLIGKVLTPSNGYAPSQISPLFLNDGVPTDNATSSKTNEMVEGYRPRRKKGPKKTNPGL